MVDAAYTRSLLGLCARCAIEPCSGSRFLHCCTTAGCGLQGYLVPRTGTRITSVAFWSSPPARTMPHPCKQQRSPPRHFMPNRKTKKQEHKGTRTISPVVPPPCGRGSYLPRCSSCCPFGRLARGSVDGALALPWPLRMYNQSGTQRLCEATSVRGTQFAQQYVRKESETELVTNSKMCNANLAFFRPLEPTTSTTTIRTTSLYVLVPRTTTVARMIQRTTSYWYIYICTRTYQKLKYLRYMIPAWYYCV